MNDKKKQLVSSINNWTPATDDKVASLKSLISKVQSALNLAENKLNVEIMEEIHAEIDSQIIITANWLSENIVPQSFWLNELYQCAKTIGELKSIIEYHLSNREYGSFTEISNFYGNLKSNPPSNEYNEEQYVTFLKHFNGSLDLEVTFFENNFDSVNKKLVFKHFFDNLVNTQYLDKTELKNYLVLAFEKKEKPNLKFNFKNNPSKKSIRKVFNDYENNISKKKVKHPDYVMLLSNYFKDYEYDNTRINWHR
jgi:hypothetical protein